jgi:XRE family transcriptional regulator, aerobic/anaerobic benzoate catabolism transcriptional regulator
MRANADPQPALMQIPPTQEEEFLRGLGKRVRASRNLRSLTRKALAVDAGVSERHLAQLEAGEGNVSVVLLRRIASALGVPLADLFASDANAPSERDRIALIGLRGAGKSTLGARLASDMSVPFIELDHEIEKDTGMPLAEIFSLYGQSGYRAIERRTLERVTRDQTRAVFSIGGGVVSEKETYDYLLANCYTVWIKAQPEEHMSRVIAQGDFRAMAGNDRAMDDLRRILEDREPLYRKADMVLDTSGDAVEESFAKLKAGLKANLKP